MLRSCTLMMSVAAIAATISALRAQSTERQIYGKGAAMDAPDLTFAGVTDPNVIRFSKKSFGISFCPALSCVDSPSDTPSVPTPSFYDHQRASFLISGATQDDNHSEEQNLAVITTIATGYHKPYAASTLYKTGDNTVVGNAVYRAVKGGVTGTNSAPPPTRPTAAQGGTAQFIDGRVTWQWINDAAIAAKVGSYIETQVLDGAGAAWGAAFNYHIKTTPLPSMFLPGVEMDYSNDSGQPCALGVTDCTALRLGLGGSQVTEGLQIVGNDKGSENFSSLWALRINGDKIASQSAIEVDAASPVGLGFGISGLGGASHSDSSIKDASDSTILLRDVGSHINGIDLGSAKYTGAQIVGKGFTVYPNGRIAGLSYNEQLSTPVSSSAECNPGDFTDDKNFHYVCVERNKWKRVLLSSF